MLILISFAVCPVLNHSEYQLDTQMFMTPLPNIMRFRVCLLNKSFLDSASQSDKNGKTLSAYLSTSQSTLHGFPYQQGLFTNSTKCIIFTEVLSRIGFNNL